VTSLKLQSSFLFEASRETLPDEVRMEAWSEQAGLMFLLTHFVALGQRLVTAAA